jgi:radical SAM superfamily enzyme YgiQ (UPF0313 family)
VKDILLITPPFTQLNTPYPATAYLKGFLNTKDLSSHQADLGIDVINAIFCKEGLLQVFTKAERLGNITDDNVSRIYALRQAYLDTIEDVITFLQGDNSTLARLICSEQYLPEGSRFNQIQDIEWAFGAMGIQDKAKYLATMYLEDIADFIKVCVDPNFGFSRYAERLGMSANSFDELYHELQGEQSFVDTFTLPLLEKLVIDNNPKLICFSVPFPGNLYSAFKCAQHIKRIDPNIKIAMGGGFPNTELRSITDPRVFEFFDFITLDDGELPIEIIISNILNPSEKNPNYNLYKRTFLMVDNVLVYNNHSLRKDYQQVDLGTPDYSDLHLDTYISVIEMANPMHSLWSDGRWNKLTMAHGCYWGKCTFCDISLDYIKNYQPIAAKVLVDRMQDMVTQTGERGFHFVDEAAPPALMRDLAIEILRRGLQVRWWTNIRFEKSFTADLCRLLQASGCIAVSGGLEVASNRLLKIIQKGVTVEQVAQVSNHFTEAGIMVHAYLMYAYPTQTIQETVDSLEMVRQLFETGIIQSGFWHQFAMTAHSPVGMDPESFDVIAHPKEISFADNEVAFTDKTGIDHDIFSFGLKKSLYNYMHGACFEFDLQEWFDFNIPNTTVEPDFISNCMKHPLYTELKASNLLLWTGTIGNVDVDHEKMKLTIYNKQSSQTVILDKGIGEWLITILPTLSSRSGSINTVKYFQDQYGLLHSDFLEFWYDRPMEELKRMGLLIL